MEMFSLPISNGLCLNSSYVMLQELVLELTVDVYIYNFLIIFML